MRARSAVDTEGLWNGAPQRLDRVAVELGLVRSRSRAAELIGAGGIAIDGVPATKPGAKVTAGARVSVTGDDHYVSRGAHKLVAALDEFALDATGRLALDLGASTGGFTQVLLERGANTVLAVDVGHDQLAPELRGDDRVRVVEGCNARELDADMLAELTGVADRPSLVVADLSFISLTLILPAITRCTDDGPTWPCSSNRSSRWAGCATASSPIRGCGATRSRRCLPPPPATGSRCGASRRRPLPAAKETENSLCISCAANPPIRENGMSASARCASPGTRVKKGQKSDSFCARPMHAHRLAHLSSRGDRGDGGGR